MKKTSLECLHRGETLPVWEKLVKPETPEEPLYRIIKNKESGYFEAVFALSLEGVANTRHKESKNKNDDEVNLGDQEKNGNFLLSCLTERQALEFVYSAGRDETGNPLFHWKIFGTASGETLADTVTDAKQLWQNLKVVMETSKRGYYFNPVQSYEMLLRDEKGEGWIGVINTVGIEVNTEKTRQVGFRNINLSEDGKVSSVIVPPFSEKTTGEHHFDTVTAVMQGLSGDIELSISFIPFVLNEKDVQTIASALKWLKNGTKKQISYYFKDHGVDDSEIMKNIQHNLVQWIKNPSGFKMVCNVLSNHPIPSSYLIMLGSEIFNCPISVSLSQIAKEVHVAQIKSDIKEILSLQDCINTLQTLPNLFPSLQSLNEQGIKKIYNNAVFNLPSEGIVLGRLNNRALVKDVRFTKADRSRHCYIIGATGTGKSTLLFNMLKQDIANGEGVALIDPHGDLYQEVLNSIPRKRINDVVLVNPCDFEYAVGINLLECSGRYRNVQMNFAVNEMIKIFDRLYDLQQTGGPIFEQYMRNAMFLLMDSDYKGATLTDIPLLFEDRDFRKFLKLKCKSPLIESFWTHQAEEACGEATLRNVAPYITSKLNQFVANPLLRPIIGQPKSSIDFREVMDKKQILLINLSKGMLGELDTQLLGMLIIGKIFSAAMGRINQSLEDRKQMFLYVDEFQNFTTDSVAHLLSEARKFGICLTLANQNLSQLSANKGKQNILDSVLGNVGSTIVFRLGARDAENMEVYTKPELRAQDLQELPDYSAAVRLLNNNAPTMPFVFNTLQMRQLADCSKAEEIISLSTIKYTKPIAEIENNIIKRRTRYSEEVEEKTWEDMNIIARHSDLIN